MCPHGAATSDGKGRSSCSTTKLIMLPRQALVDGEKRIRKTRSATATPGVVPRPARSSARSIRPFTTSAHPLLLKGSGYNEGFISLGGERLLAHGRHRVGHRPRSRASPVDDDAAGKEPVLPAAVGQHPTALPKDGKKRRRQLSGMAHPAVLEGALRSLSELRDQQRPLRRQSSLRWGASSSAHLGLPQHGRVQAHVRLDCRPGARAGRRATVLAEGNLALLSNVEDGRWTSRAQDHPGRLGPASSRATRWELSSEGRGPGDRGVQGRLATSRTRGRCRQSSRR